MAQIEIAPLDGKKLIMRLVEKELFLMMRFYSEATSKCQL